MPKSSPIRRLLQLSALGALFTISGCTLTQQPHYSPYYDYTNTNFLPEALALKLHAALPDQQFVIAHSPWGDNAQIRVTDRYFAASGRTCLKLSVNTQYRPAVVCQYNENWVLNPDILSASTQG